MRFAYSSRMITQIAWNPRSALRTKYRAFFYRLFAFWAKDSPRWRSRLVHVRDRGRVVVGRTRVAWRARRTGGGLRLRWRPDSREDGDQESDHAEKHDQRDDGCGPDPDDVGYRRVVAATLEPDGHVVVAGRDQR